MFPILSRYNKDSDKLETNELLLYKVLAMTSCILIIEDNEELCRILQLTLEANGYKVVFANDGVKGMRAFEEIRPDLVVLDISLPQMDGWEICQRIRRKSDIPILMMTATAVSEEDIAAGLEMGADEFMIKPIGKLEFPARVKALLRRAKPTQYSAHPTTTYKDDYLIADLSTRRIQVDTREIRLTPTEFNLLALFIQNSGRVLTFTEILEKVWGKEYKHEHHYPRIYVSHLRRKIEPDYKNPTYIHNEYGVGYRFVAQN